MPSLGEASATDAVDGSPVITNDAPDMFPIGTTTITWNATDSAGNWATATQLVTVSGDDLDSDWHYVLRWHEGGWGHAAITFAKHFDSITIEPSDVGQGDAHLFKTFRTDDIRNRGITIKSDVFSPQSVTIYVLDGAYSKHIPSDFTLSGGPALKGGGILASYTLPDMPKSFKPDWARSQLDETTLVISLEKKTPIKNFKIHSVEFEGHSKWTFEDYKVQQRGDKGTYILLPTRPSVYGLPVHDTFDGSLDGWTYWGHTADYVLMRDDSAGMPAPSALISVDQFDVFAGMSKIVDVSSVQDGQRLMLSYDYRASSGSTHDVVTNSLLRVLDADTGEVLFKAEPAFGGTTDTGWRPYSTDLTDEVAGSDRIEIVLGLHDSWIARWGQSNWYDNVAVYQTIDTAAYDYSPVIRILHPKPGQFIAENTDISQGGPGAKIWPDYVAKRHDGTRIPSQDLDIAFTMHGPEPDKTVRGFYPSYHIKHSEYGQTTLTVSYTDTVDGRDYTTTESVTFYMGSTRK